MTDAIVVEDLHKSYGKVKALNGLSLTVRDGSVHALLGPNGSGKTTLVRILATLLLPDSGKATMYGVDVTATPHQIRNWIALTGQRVATDGTLTGRENLELIARLHRLDRSTAQRRASELLAGFELQDAANRAVRTYSGGMQRRLDLAMSLVIQPRVLFLDEPTINLDPHSRHVIWKHIERFARAEGVTVVLTTQYLEEADRLADHVTLIDRGKTIADGTPDELKARASGDRIEITLSNGTDLQQAEQLLGQHSDGAVTVDVDALQLVAPVISHIGVLPRVVRALDEAHIEVADLAVRRPTLDDAFLALTGHKAEDQRHKRTRRGAAKSAGA
jgi:ABC-2 type transport system ATP-binding protein